MKPVNEPLLKRPFDVILSGAGLLFSMPIWLVIAAAIKLDDGGPVFYGQERVGVGGRRFPLRSPRPSSRSFPSLSNNQPIEAQDTCVPFCSITPSHRAYFALIFSVLRKNAADLGSSRRECT